MKTRWYKDAVVYQIYPRDVYKRQAIGCGTVGQGSISFLMRITALSCIKGFHPAIVLEMRFVFWWMAQTP